MNTQKRNLAVKLTTEELLDRGAQLAAAMEEHAKLDIEKSVAAKNFKERMGGVHSRAVALRNAVASGIEYRDVECRVEKDILAKKLRWIRTDTEEMVDERDLFTNELQGEFPGMEDGEGAAADAPEAEKEAAEKAPKRGGKAAKRKKDENAGQTDEQRAADSPEEAEALREQRLAAEAEERAKDDGAAPGPVVPEEGCAECHATVGGFHALWCKQTPETERTAF